VEEIMDVAALQARYEAACTFGRPVNETAIATHVRRFFGADITVNILTAAAELSKGVVQLHRSTCEVTNKHAARSSAANSDAWYTKTPDVKAAWRTQAAKVARCVQEARGLKRIMDFQPGCSFSYHHSWKLADSAIVAIGAAARGNTRLFEQWLPMLEAFEAGAWRLYLSNNRVFVVPLPEVVLHNDVAVVTWPELRLCLDDHSRLHCADGPALVSRSRWSEIDDMRYYLHGVEVQPEVILQPYRNACSIRNVERVTGETDAVLRNISTIERIDTFPPEQAALWPEYVARWETIGLSTEPADRALAEEGVRLSYAAAGLRPPQQIIWTLSPGTSVTPFAKLFTNSHGIFDEKAAARVPLHIYEWTTERVMHRLHQTISFGATAFIRVGEPNSPRSRLRDMVRTQAWHRTLMAMSAWEREIWHKVSSFPHLTPYGPLGRVGTTLLFGQHEASLFAEYAFYREVCGLVTETEPLVGPLLIAQSAGWWLPSRGICWISERPRRMQFDAHNRLHCEDGPAIEYRDGWGVYYLRGRQVSREIFRRLETVTVADIENERNVEIRRVMLERYGETRYLEESGATVVDEGEYGVLYRRDFLSGEPLVMLRVLNSTPEWDGSYKPYWLRVPPTMRTAHEAVAWTFGLTPGQYRPDIES
jgi:hypothetical protein